FANDRVIQSAPMHQTFTGLRPGEHPFTRHAQLGPSALGQTSHIHHVPATQTANRLPPLADVFAHDRLDAPRAYPAQSPSHASHPNIPPPVPSPGFPPPPFHQHAAGSGPAALSSSRAREFRSAEEAVQNLVGGREELMPKLVHYGGAQPPTPPSPMPGGGPPRHQSHSQPSPHQQQQQQNQHSQQQHPPQSASSAQQHPAPQHLPPVGPHAGDERPDILARTSSMNGRRRGREEYEGDNGSPPSQFGGGGRPEPKRAAFAVQGEAPGEEEGQEDWTRGMSGAEKRAEFLRLCQRAWDLFHS
ncbi:hypothetical protein LTR53_018072, partial [Teratosphaeriaceae sp. CCFEE 6253]